MLFFKIKNCYKSYVILCVVYTHLFLAIVQINAKFAKSRVYIYARSIVRVCRSTEAFSHYDLLLL